LQLSDGAVGPDNRSRPQFIDFRFEQRLYEGEWQNVYITNSDAGVW
jgi:hypothetical protein